MRHFALRFFAIALLAVFVAAWSKEDHEIFRLQDEVTASEGQNVTFYSFLGVKSSASQTELSKAYRKKSKQIHPDKAKRAFVASYAKPSKDNKGKKPGVHVSKGPSEKEIQAALKQATERFARLGIIVEILKGPGRERYDHFLSNGFPTWKGTGYYYSRFRPGLGSVMFGLFLVFGGGAHYAALVVSWKRQVEFVDRYIRHARRAAWGDEMGIKGIPDANDAGANEDNASGGAAATSSGASDGDAAPPAVMNRRQKRMMDKESRKDGGKKSKRGSGTSTPQPGTSAPTGGDRKRVIAENGKVLIVDSTGSVYLEEENEDGVKEEFLLDTSEIHRPTARDTLVFQLPVWLYQKCIGRIFGTSTPETAAGDQETEEGAEEVGDIIIPDSVADDIQQKPKVSSSSNGRRKKKGRKG